MKMLLIAALLSTAAFADHHEEKEQKIEDVKARVSGNIDQKISALQAHKSCVSSASTKEAIGECRKSHKDSMKKLHQENKGERTAWKDGMKSKREERKANKKK